MKRLIKVLVLNPPVKGTGFTRDGRCQSNENAWLAAFPPEMLAGIAGTARENFHYNVKLIDCIGSKISFEKCLKLVTKYNPNFTVLNTSMPTFKGDMVIAKKIKRKTKSKLIVYGEFVTSSYKEVLKKHKYINFVVRGEAGTPIIKILAGEAQKKKVAGVVTRKYVGEIWQEPNLDKLPIPAYDLLPPYYYPLKGKRWVFMRLGRGCPYACKFCVAPTLSGRKVRYHSVDYMIKQIKFINRLNIYYFMLWHEIATFNKKYMLDLCKAMKRNNLHKKNHWACTTRVDHFYDELAKKMKEAGCFLISFGIESASQRVLDINNKQIKIQDSINAIKSANKYRIMSIGHFIIGLPGSTRKTIEESIRFSKKLKLSIAQFYTATPYRGSQLYAYAKKQGLLVEKKYKDMDQRASNLKYKHLSDKEIERLRKKAYVLFYLRPFAVWSLMKHINPKVFIKLPLLIKKFFKWIF